MCGVSAIKSGVCGVGAIKRGVCGVNVINCVLTGAGPGNNYVLKLAATSSYFGLWEAVEAGGIAASPTPFLLFNETSVSVLSRRTEGLLYGPCFYFI